VGSLLVAFWGKTVAKERRGRLVNNTNDVKWGSSQQLFRQGKQKIGKTPEEMKEKSNPHELPRAVSDVWIAGEEERVPKKVTTLNPGGEREGNSECVKISV